MPETFNQSCLNLAIGHAVRLWYLQPLKRFVNGLDGLFDVCRGVRGGDEGGFELGRGEVGAAFQRVMEELGVSGRVGFLADW